MKYIKKTVRAKRALTVEKQCKIEYSGMQLSKKIGIDNTISPELEGCIVLNEHNTVFARSGPLYATGVFLGPPASWMQTASRSLQACFARLTM